MKTAFRKVKLSKNNKDRLILINSIIEEYQHQWYVLTLRQLYYQLVSRDVIPNKSNEYSKLSTLLKEWRMWRIVDWDAIEDRVRKPFKPYCVDDINEAISDTIDQYRLDRMSGQDVYIEVWVEKDALSGVLKRVTSKYWINIMVNRWYSSASAMYDAFRRFQVAHDEGKSIRILYLWDYDPSWIDMIRDIRDRITEFMTSEQDEEYYWDCDFDIIPIALTLDQIKTFNPPPNPAKMTDPRSKEFVSKHWYKSWEVDALKPQILNKILIENIEDLINKKTYEKIILQEYDDKKKLKEIMF